DRALELLSHILAVSSIWLRRARQEAEVTKRFDRYTLEECANRNDALLSDWTQFTRGLPDLNAIMKFQLLGRSSQMKVVDCVHHVGMHGTYHRGQIVALLKDHLNDLPATDFVLFALENPRL
ncbi:MAG TPA: DinB family protein, partial [Ohtaekwangia sp.]|nr:DinB family protein [Ohtaekwangia sp.]